MNKMIGRVLRPLMLALALIAVGLTAIADKGIETTVDIGAYRFTVLCHYEPEQYAEVTGIDLVKGPEKSDSALLRFPTEVMAYGDTFPVTEANRPNLSRKLYPEIIDCANLHRLVDTRSYNYFISKVTREIIFGEQMEYINIPIYNTSIKHIDLKNITSFGSSFVSPDSWKYHCIVQSVKLT